MKMGMTHATLERNAAVGEMGKLKREMQQKEKDMEQVRVLINLIWLYYVSYVDCEILEMVLIMLF